MQALKWMASHISWVVVGVIIVLVGMGTMSGTFGIIASAEGERARDRMMLDNGLAILAVVALRFVARWEGSRKITQELEEED